MTVLVTGPDGVLGSNLVRVLCEKGYSVNVLLEKKSTAKTLEGLSVSRFYGDILNLKELDAAIKGCDVVIHGAASTSVFPARNPFVRRVNVDGTKNIIEACLKNTIKRLVFVGTANSFCFGDESNPGKEVGPYVSKKYGLDYMDSKREAQELVLKAVKEQKLPAVVVNPTFMIGPYDSKPSSGAMILGIYKKAVPGYTSGGKNYIAVKDAAIATANAIDQGRIGECYILGNKNLSYKDAFSLIAGVVGVSAPKRRLAPFFVVSYGFFSSFFAKIFRFNPSITKELAVISCEKHYYSSKKAIKELNLPQTPIEEAVRECFFWFKENGYLK